MSLDLSTIATIVGIVGTLLGGAWAVGKVLTWQFNAGLDQRFKAQDAARLAGAQSLKDSLERNTAQSSETQAQLRNLEGHFFALKAELPEKYVRREDYIRGQQVLEAKQDALHSEIRLLAVNVAALKGPSHVGD